MNELTPKVISIDTIAAEMLSDGGGTPIRAVVGARPEPSELMIACLKKVFKALRGILENENIKFIPVAGIMLEDAAIDVDEAMIVILLTYEDKETSVNIIHIFPSKDDITFH